MHRLNGRVQKLTEQVTPARSRRVWHRYPCGHTHPTDGTPPTPGPGDMVLQHAYGCCPSCVGVWMCRRRKRGAAMPTYEVDIERDGKTYTLELEGPRPPTTAEVEALVRANLPAIVAASRAGTEAAPPQGLGR